jgi:hypothetical protein
MTNSKLPSFQVGDKVLMYDDNNQEREIKKTP